MACLIVLLVADFFHRLFTPDEGIKIICKNSLMCHTFWHMHVVKSRAVKKFNIIMTDSRDKRKRREIHYV